MQTRNDLTCPCNESIGCVSQITSGSILSTSPELLSSTAGPPSDSQATVLRSEIERAKQEISTASLHIAHLQDALARLLRHREEMENLVRTNTGVLSTLRRFPNELLLEVFHHTLVESPAVHQVPWVLSEVCSHWRRVTLAAPFLWSRFPPLSFGGDRPFSTPMMSVQLDRAERTPLCIDLGNLVSPDTLALLLPVVSQWHDVAIPLTSLMSPQLTGHIFSTLNNLTLTSPAYIPGHPSTSDIDRVSSLPSLMHLRLDMGRFATFPRHLVLPWSQLHICDLYGVGCNDVSWILPRLSHGTLVVIIGSNFDVSPPNKTTSLARSLTFTNCTYGSLVNIISNLSTPVLSTLIVQSSGPKWFVEPIWGLLDRSACSLQHLHLDCELSEDDLARFLESPHVHSAIDLNFRRAHLSPRSIAALATLPNLRALVICGASTDETALIAALTTQHLRVISHPSEASERSGAMAGERRFRFTLT
ncbi:hypothetical protein C8R46DRAFT_183599 [Mycena filopes]|nr:hypothetical protein C8R46DRAFT_183599 [Mycena filopes]